MGYIPYGTEARQCSKCGSTFVIDKWSERQTCLKCVRETEPAVVTQADEAIAAAKVKPTLFPEGAEL